jgi:hypothetical protein
MSVTFKSSTLQSLYNGSTPALATSLATFRTGGEDDEDADILALDERIAAFESILLGTLPDGRSSVEYPYDREGMKREFLDEVVALLARRSYSGLTINNTYTNSGVLRAEAVQIEIPNPAGGASTFVNPSNFVGTRQVVLTNAYRNFDTLYNADPALDQRKNLLNTAGDEIYDQYSALIDAIFAEGDKLGNNPSTPVQVTGAILPIEVDGYTYDRVATVSGVNATTGAPEVQSYLLQTTAANGQVVKNSAGDATVGAVANPGAFRIRLSPVEASNAVTATDYIAAVDSGAATVRFPSPAGSPPTLDVTLLGVTSSTTAVPISAIMQSVPGRESEFPEFRITSSYRATLADGRSFLIGLSSEGKVYVTSLESTRRETVNTTVGLSPVEYLLYWNEARIKILRAKLAYAEAVVREIQEDLKQANKALADLETSSGAVTATDTDGQPTGQYSAETTYTNLFVATASTRAGRMFDGTASDMMHSATEWQKNRTELKNYIDRRSAEAQQATLDYQNVLNRYNNAFEVMGKLQEKLDTLLKAQLRNF